MGGTECVATIGWSARVHSRSCSPAVLRSKGKFSLHRLPGVPVRPSKRKSTSGLFSLSRDGRPPFRRASPPHGGDGRSPLGGAGATVGSGGAVQAPQNRRRRGGLVTPDGSFGYAPLEDSVDRPPRPAWSSRRCPGV